MHSVSSAHFDFNLNIVGHSSSIGILLCTISSLSLNFLFMNRKWTDLLKKKKKKRKKKKEKKMDGLGLISSNIRFIEIMIRVYF